MNSEKFERVKAEFREAKRRNSGAKTASEGAKTATETPKTASPEQIAAAVEAARKEERARILAFARAVGGPGPDVDRLDKAVKAGVTPEQMRSMMEFLGKAPTPDRTPEKRPAGVETGRSGRELLQKLKGVNGMTGESIQKENVIPGAGIGWFRTYEEAAQFFVDNRGMSKADALQEAARKFPRLHREYIERANRGEPIQQIY